MRWLVVTDDFPPLDGGVATWTQAVAGALHRDGHVVTALARARAGLGRGLPYRVIGVPGPSFGRRGGLWTAVGAAPHLARADRILASTWPVASVLAPVATRLGVPLHVVAHGSDVTRPLRDPAAFARTFRSASRAWGVSRYLCGVLAQFGVTADVLPAPVDAGPAIDRARTGRAWVMVGRATALKGGERFVQLVRAAGVRGTVFGDGPCRPRWEALARSVGADVDFRGDVSRAALAAELPAFDVAFLLPRADADGSGAEGFGLALVEAAAAGVATVGCATGGVPEALGAGLLLQDPDDAVASAAAVTDWWTPERGEACRTWVAAHAGTAAVVRRLIDSPLPR